LGSLQVSLISSNIIKKTQKTPKIPYKPKNLQ
jgi:hypothetical protein